MQITFISSNLAVFIYMLFYSLSKDSLKYLTEVLITMIHFQIY